MTIQSIGQLSALPGDRSRGADAATGPGDAELMAMAAPQTVATPLWNLANAAERRQMLATPIQLAGAGTLAAPMPATGAVSIDLAALMRGVTAGVGPYAAIVARFGVLSLPLALSGDTPQPAAQDIGFGDLTLRLTAPRAHAAIGEPGTRAEFRMDKPGWFHFGEGTRRLDVPVTVQNGQLSFDPAALQAAYGGQLPPGILAMAGRPAGVPAALQTTSQGIATAMAGAPDPCRNLPGQRHHIIPAEIMGANESFLTRIGFRLDQPANMIKLPANTTQRNDMSQLCGETRPIHNGRHPQAYGSAISDKLQQIEAQGLSASDSRALVNRLMSTIRAEINSGGYASVNDPRLVAFIRSISL